MSPLSHLTHGSPEKNQSGPERRRGSQDSQVLCEWSRTGFSVVVIVVVSLADSIGESGRRHEAAELFRPRFSVNALGPLFSADDLTADRPTGYFLFLCTEKFLYFSGEVLV